MPSTFTLDARFEAFVQAQLATGRYHDANAVLSDALRLMQEREVRLAALDAAIARAIVESDAGDVHDLDDVFDELEAELAALPDHVA